MSPDRSWSPLFAALAILAFRGFYGFRSLHGFAKPV